ncbi:rpp14/Pop5 family protein [Hirsutella rhossiliensis]|uniref:Ribonuclease P/MRP protein subunit POP5 n=1 Tax=Hirsutella rhossiliensis TaxID=111463 RepID=A0A9P8SKB1_9HYPO|nr:rpp14/Pop5 family domain-containing protein [Hirsutella rhossiliensis]KAH0964550.1 rpp14/Pop5 family domain-containing protein [Hirsutella rhossiliensis]
MVRIKERYLLVNILYPPDPPKTTKTSVPDSVVQHQPTVEKLTPAALLKAIRAEVAALFGDYGLGALEGHLSVKYLSLATSTFILRCARAHYQMLWAALFLMDRVPAKGGRPCIFRVVRVSGTMRKAEEEAIRQARGLILAAKQEASSAPAHPTAADQDVRGSFALDTTDSASDDAAMDQDDG